MTDPYDMRHQFKCKGPHCGEVFSHPLRELLHLDKVFCRKCGRAEDIRESKRSGAIFRDLDAASEMTKQANQEN